jgi:periplasmic protein TonB
MSTTVASNQEFDISLKRFLVYSAVLHVGLALAILLSLFLQRPGDAWGGVGGGSDSATKVSLVTSAGIPMPTPTTPTLSDTVDPTKGLNKEEPKPPEPKTDATKIPKFEKEKPLPISKPSKVIENKVKPPDNATNYGKGGGQLNVPTGYSQTPGAASAGLAVQGQGGSDFAARYAWYVEAVKRLISQNWQQNTIDASVRSARQARATVNFTIMRDGTVRNIRMDKSSGNASFDTSAQRALLSIDKFQSLPPGYSGQYVEVTFDFDLAMTK